MKPVRHQFTILKQICELIPASLVPKLALKHGVVGKARSFSPWSHIVALLHTQLAHALSLNDACDALRNHEAQLEAQLDTLRKASPPSRNGREMPTWPRISFGRCCPISRKPTRNLALATNILACQGDSCGLCMRWIPRPFS